MALYPGDIVRHEGTTEYLTVLAIRGDRALCEPLVDQGQKTHVELLVSELRLVLIGRAE